MQRPASATPVRNPARAMSRDGVLRDTPMSATRFTRSASSQGSRWATEDRLAIRRNPSFPIQQTAPKPYLAACAEITPHGRNWNAEFQLAWEMEDHSIEQAEQRMNALRQIEREFEKEAATTVVKIVRLEKDMPHELPKFVQCFRVKNIFFRILPDSRSGRNYVASLRGILQSSSALLSVPLSIMFYYRGMPVLAQALVPMTTQPKRLYGANSTNDAEVEAEMTFMAEALHITLPDSSMEVYEALDGRYYVTNSNATLTPLFLDDTIMKRHEMLRTCPEVIDGADNTMDVIDDSVLQDTVLQVCSSSPPTANTNATLTQLCSVLHTRGVNLCLLKQVCRRLLFAGNYDATAVHHAVDLIACEMVCRTLKQEFYIEVQGKRTAYDEVSLARVLFKYFALVFAPAPAFRTNFLDTISKKYGITAEDDDIIDVLTSFRAEWKSRIMDRVCHLLGATIRKEKGDLQISWKPFANSSVIPQLVDPRVAILLAEAYTKVRTDAPHWHAFCLPLCWKVACWQQRFSLALTLAKEDAAAQQTRVGAQQLIRWLMERCVCHVCFRTGDWACIQEGRSRFPSVLTGYEAWASAKTQGRRCTEYGFWLVDVAEGLTESPAELRSCVEEAVRYFQTAIARMPKYLRSEHGAWLHLQPYMGLLRCKKLLHSCSVDTQSLVQHSVELSNVGWASDFFINYLWDLGRELEYEGDFAAAVKVLRTAITLSKEKPTFAAELHTLLMDTAHVYRSWDLRLYAKECIDLTNEAIAYAAQYYGTESRQYGVILNNRGAIEIELGWLDQAEETLRRAGVALDAAGVPHDDLDYVAYLRNLDALQRRRHPSQPRPTALTGFLLRYPFLETGCEGIPWDDVRPLQDGAFVKLARCRAQEAAGTEEAFRLEAAMKRRVGELFRRLLAGATLKRSPFLPPQVEGLYVESLCLDHDRLFQELRVRWQRMAAESDERRLQERRMLAYVSVKARRTVRRRRYEHSVEDNFIQLCSPAVNLMLPVDFSEVVEDAEVQQLLSDYERKAAHRASGAELRDIVARLSDRVDAWEREQWDWRQSISPWVPETLLHSFFLSDLTNDGPLRDLLLARQHSTRAKDEAPMPLKVLDTRIEARCTAIWERGQLERLYSRAESQQLQQKYQLASPRLHHQDLSAIFDDLLEPWSASLYSTVDADNRDRVIAALHRRGRDNRDDEYLEQWYPRLRALRCSGDVLAALPHHLDTVFHGLQLRWHEGNCSDAALHARLLQHIEFCRSRARKARVGIMRDRLRTEATYPFLCSRYEGIHLHDLRLEEDVVFCEHYAEYTRLAAEAKLAVRRMQASEARMEARAYKVAAQLRTREAALQQRFGGFLRRGDAAPLWTAAYIEYTPRILQCEQFYTTHAAEQPTTAKIARDTARCAEEIRSYIRHMARDDAQLRLLRNASSEETAERYPFLSLRPLPTVPLSVLPFECCYDFRRENAALFVSLSDDATKAGQGGCVDATMESLLSLSNSAPPGTSMPLAERTQQLVQIVQEMAEEEVKGQRRLQQLYPGLPEEVLGVSSTQLSLPDDFSELWAQSLREGFHGPTAPLVFGALYNTATAARAVTLANLYADEHQLQAQLFLLYHTRLCVSLRHLPLQEDRRYVALLAKYEAILHQDAQDTTEASLQRVRLALRADRDALRSSHEWDRLIARIPRPLFFENNQLHHLRSDTKLGKLLAKGEKTKLKRAEAEGLIADMELSAQQDIAEATADNSLRADLPFIALHTTAQSIGRDDEFVRLQRVLKRLRSNSAVEVTQLTDAENELRDYTATFTPAQNENNTSQNTPIKNHGEKEDDTAQSAARLNRPLKQIKEQHQMQQASSTPLQSPRETENRTPTKPPLQPAKQEKRATATPRATQKSASSPPTLTSRTTGQYKEQPTQSEDSPERPQAAAKQKKPQLSSLYPFLRLHEEDGWPEAVVADAEFRKLAAEHADLMADPERNADALRDVEDAMNQRGDAVAAALRKAAALADLASRYPFLRLHEEDGWPEAVVADTEFRKLAAEHADLMADPERNADALRDVEDAMNQRGDAVAAALRKAAALADLASRYPFLRLHEEDGWPEAVVADAEFRKLAAEHADLMADPERNADALRDVEDVMNQRGDAVAAALRKAAALDDLASRYPFLRLHEEDGWPEAVVADAEFRKLAAEHADLMADPERNADALRDVEDAMNQRGDAVAAALRKAAALADLASRYPFLRLHEEDGWPEAVVADAEFRKLAAEHADLMADPERNADALRDVEDAMNQRGDAVAAALRKAAALDDLASRYPFLRLHEEDGWPEAVVADAEFRKLAAEHADLMADPERNADALRDVEDAMNQRGDAVAAALRKAAALADLASRYPFLRLHEEDGWPEAVVADAEFRKLAAEHADLMADPERNADALRDVEDAMNQRGDAVAAALRKAAALADLASRYPFLRLHEEDGWPEAVVADAEFRKLAAEHADLMADPERNADALRDVEDAMNQRGDAVAAALRKAAALDDLASRYPFLRLHEEDGWPEAVVADAEFRKLAAEHADLMADPERNADALRDVEDAMNQRGDAVAAALRKAAALADLASRYPFLRLHEEDGWPEAVVADAEFRKLAAEHADLMADPERNADALRDVEDAMNQRGDAVAAALRKAAALADLASRYPFLRLHEEDGWPEAVVADAEFRKLAAEHADLMADPERNADALRDVEDAMNQRGDAVAAALRKAAALADLASRYPFLRLHEEDGWPEAVMADAEFRKLAAEHADLMADPERNADALRDVEDAMNQRGDAVAAALRKAAALADLASRYPFLRLHEEDGWPEAVVADAEFRKLAAEHADLMADPERNADALRDVEDAMNQRGDAVAAALRKAAALADLASRYPFLRLHEEDGWPEAVVADAEFRKLAAEHADLMMDPERNADALRDVEDAMNQRGDAVAAALRKAAALADLASRYPFLRLHEEDGWPEAVVADAEFRKLAAEHADLMADPERNADALRDVEDAMNQRGDAVAAALRKAAALADLASRYPFLRLHEEDGWPEAVVADAEFRKLAAEHADLMADPERNADALRDVEDAMNQRGDAVAAALRKAAALDDLALRYPFLRLHEEDGWPEAVVADAEFRKLAAEHADLMADPERNADALRDVEDAMNQRGDAVAAALRKAAALDDLASRYPFLRLHEEDGWPEAVVADAEFRKLAAEHADLMADPERNADALRDVEDAMNQRGDAVAAALRKAAALDDLASRYPFLRLHEEDGWPEAVVADAEFRKLAAEHADLMADPERNADALRDVEDAMNQRGDAVAAALRKAAALADLASRYPFLRLHEEDGWPEAVVADAEFRKLAAEHADLMADPERNADALRDVEDAMNQRGDAVAAALRKAAALADLASRYPFLRLHEEDGWPEAVVADAEFRKLAAEHADLMADPERNADALRDVEDAMNQRGDAVAAALRKAAALADLASRYPFLRLHEEDGWPEAVVADAEFRKLAAEHADLMADPERNADALRDVEDAMNQRGDAVAAALRKAAALADLASRYPFLRLHEEDGWPEAVVADAEFRKLAAEHADLMADPERNADALRDVEDAMNQRGDAVAAALRKAAALDDLASRYPFLRLHEEDGWPEAVVADAEFRKLAAEHADLMADPERNADALRDVEDAMNQRGDAVAAALRKAAALADLASRYPFLRLHEEDGWPEAVVADAEFRKLAAEHADLMADPERNADALRDVEDVMNQRGDAVAAALRKAAALDDLASRYPFLRLHEEDGWPEAVVADAEFRKLAAEHADLMMDPERNADALRDVEDAMNQRGDAVAAALRKAAALADLASRYPFLRLHEEDGWPEAVVADAEFRKLAAEHADLMADPERNADALRDVEDAMNQRGDAVAAALRKAAALADLASRYPFLRLHEEDGWPEAVVADAEFRKLAAEHADLMADPERNADALRDVEDAMNQRGDAVAAALRKAAALADLASRYPFLRLHEEDGWPEAVVADAEFRKLAAEHADLMADPERNADALRDVEDAMNQRGDAVAAALRKAAALDDLASRYPFLRLHEEDGWPEAVVADAEFRKLAAEHADLMADPERNADALRDVEDAMNQRGDAVAAALRKAAALDDLASRYPFLRLHEEDGWPEAVVADAEFRKLAAEHADLMADPERNADALRDVEDAMNQRGDAVAAALRKAAALADLASRYPFLRLHEEDGWPEAVVADAEFRKLAAEHADLMADPERNADALRDVEDAMNQRGDAVAAALRKAAALADLASRYPFLRLHEEDGWPEAVVADAEFRKLAAEHADLMMDPERNADALRDVEDAMNQRGDAVAAALRKAAALDDLASRYPFLRLHEEDGWPEAVVADAEFRKLAAEHADLMADPERNADALRDVEDAMNQRGDAVAAALRKAAALDDLASRYPFLRLHEEDGWPEAVVADAEFRKLAAEHADLMADPERNADALRDVEDAMNQRGDAVAAALRKAAALADLASRYPFLRLHEEDGWPEAVVADAEFRKLAAEHADLMADPERNADALRDVEDAMNQRGDAVAAALRKAAALADLASRYPFLRLHEEDGWPEAVVADAEFRKLAAEHADLMADPERNADALRDVEDAMNQRGDAVAAALRKAAALADLASRYPFLRLHEEDGWPEAVVADAEFRKLAAEHADLMADPERNADALRDVEDAMNQRGDAVAAALRKAAALADLASRYPFLRLHEEDGWPEAVVADAEFRKLAAEHADLMMDPERNADALRDVEDAMNQRGDAVAAALRKAAALDDLASRYPFLRLHEEDGWPEAVVADAEFRKLAAEHADLMADPERNADALRDVEDAMNQRGDAVAAALRKAAALDDLASRYPFLRLHEEDGWPEAVVADAEFRKLAAEHADLMADPERNADALRDVEDAMNQRGDAVAAALRKAAALADLASRYPFLRLHEEDGWPEAVVADAEFRKLAAEHADLMADPERNADALRDVEDAMNQRGDAVAAALRKAAALDDLASRYPFLRLHEEDGWPEAVVADAEFRKLAAEHADLMADPERNADALRDVEDAMNQRGDAVAAALRKAAALADLASRYPFLRLHEEDGWPEAVVADAEFRKLAAEHADLMADPERNADALRDVEDAMNQRGDAVAAALRKAAALADLASRYPFLRLHEEDGWPEAVVADAEFRKLAAEHADLMADPERNADALRDVEDAMNQRGDAVAAALRKAAALDDLASRYPFLRLHEEDGWPEAVVADAEFRKLAAEHADLMADPERNADALRDVEDAMNQRGDAVAAALRKAAALADLASRYPFLRLHEEDGWPEAVVADAEFRKLAAEHADLMADPERNADALRDVEDAMNQRGDAVAAALRKAAALADLASRYPFLRLHEEDGWPEAVVADAEFRKLAAEHADLMADPERNADALRDVEDAMNQRGDAVAAALRKAAALADLASRYPFLRLHEEDGWPEAVVADAEFRKLAAEHADLMADPERNADALRDVEDAMNQRGDAVAAALRKAAALADLASRYPFLRLHEEDGWPEAVVADAEFRKLAAEHADLMADPERNADALRDVEDAMNQRGDAVAAALRKAAALADLASRYPFLRLHEEDGWPEAVVADAEFRKLAAEHADLMTDLERIQSDLRDVEDAMNARAAFLAELLSFHGVEMLFAKVVDEEYNDRRVVCAEEDQSALLLFTAAVCDEERVCRSTVECDGADGFRLVAREAARQRGVAVRELQSRLQREVEQCAAAEEAARGCIEADERGGRATVALSCAESEERAARHDVEAEAADGFRLVAREAARQHGVAVRELQSRLQREVEQCAAAEEAARGCIEADERGGRATVALSCAESEERAARHDVEAEAADGFRLVAREAARQRGVAVRELQSRLQREVEQCAAAEEAARGSIEADERGGRATVALSCAESEERAARHDVEAEAADGFRLVAREAARQRGVAVRELQSRLQREVEQCAAAEEAARGCIEADERGGRATVALSCAESEERAARHDVEAEAADGFRLVAREAARQRGVAVRELQSRLQREVEQCAAAEEAARGSIEADERGGRATVALSCAESEERAARHDVEAEAADGFRLVAREAARQRGVAVRELQSRLQREVEQCAAAEEAARGSIEADERGGRATVALSCAESEERAARHDVEAEAADGFRLVAREAARQRGVAVRELQSRLQREVEQCAAAEEAARGCIEADERGGRATVALSCAESEERAARHDVEAEAADGFRLVAREAARQRGVAVRELQSRLQREVEQCAAAEEAARGCIEADERGGRATVALSCAESEERAARHDVEAEAADGFRLVAREAARQRGVAVRELQSRLQREVEQCAAAEEAARGCIEADERGGRATVALSCAESEERAARHDVEAEAADGFRLVAREAARQHGVAVRELQSRLEAEIRSCGAEEDRSRRCVMSKEERRRTALFVDKKLELKTLSMYLKQRNSIVEDESVSRRGVELDERGDRALLLERHETVFSYLSTVYENVKREKEVPKAAASSLCSEKACGLLQRVGRGRLLRKKLQRRLENRRREFYNRGVARILADEFTQRRDLVGEEYLVRQGLLERLYTTVPVTLNGHRLSPALQEVLMEEESRRRDLLDDYNFTRAAIERAEHKQFLKHSSVFVTPEASDSSDEEDDREVAPPNLQQPADVALSALRRESTPRRRYKGFELDALGRFLLDYESDLNRMQMELADFRRHVAFEHDQVKDARDRAAQEVVRGGTGAMWVPARPLPLSDLVRGPNTQYDGKKRY